MARQARKWSNKFLQYMNMIVENENYEGLPIERKQDGTWSWITTAKSKVGQGRIAWANKKADELGIEKGAGMYAAVMLAVHPTKWKVCQTCGSEMSLYYHYPNANFLKKLNDKFGSNFNECDHINDIWNALISSGYNNSDIAKFMIDEGHLNLNPLQSSQQEVIQSLEITCRKGVKKCLGPGAMSNFPDRYDGFHTYNRCCRAKQDKGRSKENLKSYTKDRRAYEYWSDGNIHAANQFMGSRYFKGSSADHIGSISLGFVHDPRYLQPMSTGDNSAKRDRLQVEDIELILDTEKRTGVYPMSWQSKLIWEHICKNYKSHPEKVPSEYRDALKQNMNNFMYILKFILDSCKIHGVKFLTKMFLEPKQKFFDASYGFNKFGEIVAESPRHYTTRNENEMKRYQRIAIDSVYEYDKKDNRNIKNDLTNQELNALARLCKQIEDEENFSKNKETLTSIVEAIEKRIINTL